MRIAGSTIRRGYLKRYEKNYSDKYDSEKKVQTGRKFVRASENPIDAARALRVRRSIEDVETYQRNLESADSIYNNAETSMRTVSGIIQTVYEKLIEGAHGTRNRDDLKIIATELENHAEEMVQSFNIDVADRKIFGGLNNETLAFKIEDDGMGGKYVTYNGVAVNSSSDPNSFPYSGTSYLDIGIGMATDGNIKRIDDQSALPITFNGAECSGCGVTSRTASIDLKSISPGLPYKINISAGGTFRTISFNGGDTDKQTVENINAALKEAFQLTPEVGTDGKIKYLDNLDLPTAPNISNYKNATLNALPGIDFNSLQEGEWYSLEVEANGKTRVIDFAGTGNMLTDLDAIRTALNDKFGEEDAPKIYTDGAFIDAKGDICPVKNCSDYSNDVNIAADGTLDLASLTDGEQYTLNVAGQKVTFTAGPDVDTTVKNLNDAFKRDGIFGEPAVPYMTDTGALAYDKKDAAIVIDNAANAPNKLEFSEIKGYSKNIMQLVLDGAQALRDGDQLLAARYADLIYKAQGSLSIAIADLGTHSKFIEFNQEKLDDTLINLYDKQNSLEITDLPYEITNWKVLESVYNATLQMGSQMLAQTIFDYIR